MLPRRSGHLNHRRQGHRDDDGRGHDHHGGGHRAGGLRAHHRAGGGVVRRRGAQDGNVQDEQLQVGYSEEILDLYAKVIPSIQCCSPYNRLPQNLH